MQMLVNSRLLGLYTLRQSNGGNNRGYILWEGYSHQSLLYIEDKINRAKHEPDSEVRTLGFL